MDEELNASTHGRGAVALQPDSPMPPRRGGAFRSLRHRNFQLYFGGQLISVAGTWMQVIAQGWLVYQLTHSELALGVVGFAAALPVLFIAPFGGVLVDRVPKRSLLVWTQTAAMLLAFILAFLGFTGMVQVWHIVVLAAALGAVNAFDAPGRQAFTVEMVGRDDLSNAIALNSMMFNGGRVIGPAVGGLLLAIFGPAWCFFINGVSFLAVIFGLIAMQVPPHRPAHGAASPLRQLASGLNYTWKHQEVMAIILLSAIFSIFGISYAAVLPAFVDQALHAGASSFGLINAVTGMGAVTGAVLLARERNLPRRGVLLAYANLTFCLALLAFAWNHSLLVSLPLAFALGLGFMTQFTTMNTLLQLRIDDQMRGRVLSLYTLTFFGLSPFGNLAVGYLSQVWGLTFALTAGALTALLLTIAVFLWVPSLLKLE